MYCQGHDSAPGLDIMLLKQQYLCVSGQVTHQVRHPPPVVYCHGHPLLQFLPQKLAEWIVNNYAAELNVPPRPDPSRPWSTATLNWILQTSMVSDSRWITIHTFQTVEFESDLYSWVMSARCYPFNMEHHRFRGRNVKWVHIHGICIVSHVCMLIIYLVYTCSELIMLTAGLFGNYPSASILHWGAWWQLWRCNHYLIWTACVWYLCFPSCSSAVHCA